MSFVDDNLGMVLDALEKEGLDKNTIVVFLADHGFHLGDHGCWSKYSMLEATRRVPLLSNPDQPWKKAVFMVDGDGGRMVRTRRHSYLELKKGPVPKALYDFIMGDRR